MPLECIPNRDALRYEKIFGIEGVETLCRGTLRFRGFSGIMHFMKRLGLLDEQKSFCETWDRLLDNIVADKGHATLPECLLACSHEHKQGDAEKLNASSSG